MWIKAVIGRIMRRLMGQIAFLPEKSFSYTERALERLARPSRAINKRLDTSGAARASLPIVHLSGRPTGIKGIERILSCLLNHALFFPGKLVDHRNQLCERDWFSDVRLVARLSCA
jgi:hypothetical protein